MEITEEYMEAAYKVLANGSIKAVGYRIIVLPLESRIGMEGVEIEQFPTLKKISDELGEEFVTKTAEQKAREDKGSDVGILVGVGPEAFKRLRDGVAWAAEGDVVVFHRYAGHDIEFPPSSGQYFKMLNDEDLMGKIGACNE